MACCSVTCLPKNSSDPFVRPQREVFDLLVAGERSKQIARQLGIGEKTVAKHRATVLEKMQVDSVVELVCLFSGANPTHGIGHTSVAQFSN